MAAIQIAIEPKALNATKEMLAAIQKGNKGVMSRAINTTLRGVRTDVTREIKDSVNLTTTFIQQGTSKAGTKTFYLSYATKTAPTGTITTRGANVPLIQYSNQRGTKATYPKSITVEVKKARGKTKLRHAFIPKLESGHRGLFEYEFGTATTGRRKIKEMYGPRIPDILSNAEVMSKVEANAKIRMDKNLSHEIDYFFSAL